MDRATPSLTVLYLSGLLSRALLDSECQRFRVIACEFAMHCKGHHYRKPLTTRLPGCSRNLKTYGNRTILVCKEQMAKT